MVDSKRPKHKNNPKNREIVQKEDPDKYYDDYPSWNFKMCDDEKWAFTEKTAHKAFWTEILPYLQSVETRKWGDILINSKKQNHSEPIKTLNAVAQKRLAERNIEAEILISLRITGKHRLYGYIIGSVFNILWYDTDHGDNPNCVCRSHKKHT